MVIQNPPQEVMENSAQNPPIEREFPFTIFTCIWLFIFFVRSALPVIYIYIYIKNDLSYIYIYV